MIPVLLGLGALCVLWYWNTHKDAIIRSKIEKAIQEKSNGLYTINYDSTDMNELQGNLSFYNMHLAYDSAKYLAAEKKGIAPPLLFTIDIPEISVSGVSTSRAMSNNEIVGQKLIIKNPVIDLFYTYQGKDAGTNMPTDEVYKEILGGLKLVQVDTIVLSEATIRTMNKKTGKILTEGRNINITLLDVKIDSAAFEDKSRMMFSKSVSINVGNIKWASSDKLYNFNIGNISLNSVTNTMNVARFDMKAVLGEDAYVKAIPFQDDRFDLSFSNINLTGIDPKKLLDENLEAETMTLSSSLKIYRDLGRPRDKKNRVGKYPHEVLDDVPIGFAIKKIIINDSYIEYKERSHITRESGKVRLHHVNGVLSNFTNNKKAAGQEMTATINCRFLDKTAFSTNWKFYLFHPQGRFDLTGKMGPIDGTSLNELAEPMGPAHIREGKLNALDFTLHGDDHNTNASVKLLYENLKVDVLEKDKDGGKSDKKFLTSLLANVIIKNSNPKKNEAARVANVSMARNTNRSIFYMCWKTLFKGIRETVGIKQEQAVAKN